MRKRFRRAAFRSTHELEPAPTLDREGFELAHFESAVESFEGATIPAYYREVEELVKRETGARRVVAFDHNLRSSARGVRWGDGPNEPVRCPHNDYSVRDLLPDEAEDLLRRRFAVVNV
jgi:hypothetical protein